MTANRGAYLSREISNWMGFLALYPSRHLGIHRLLFYISRPSPPLVHPSRAGTGRNRIRFHEFARKLFTARHNTGGTIWRVGEASSFYISLVCFPFLLTNDDEDGHVFIRNFESHRGVHTMWRTVGVSISGKGPGCVVEGPRTRWSQR